MNSLPKERKIGQKGNRKNRPNTRRGPTSTAKTTLDGYNLIFRPNSNSEKNCVVYGRVPEIEFEQTFDTRLEISKAALHRPIKNNIHFGPEGPCSVLIDRNPSFLRDAGGTFVYSATVSLKSKRLRQDVKGFLLAKDNQIPIRVIRSSDSLGATAPSTGFRYDGLYRVAYHWKVKDHQNDLITYNFRFIGDAEENSIRTGGLERRTTGFSEKISIQTPRTCVQVPAAIIERYLEVTTRIGINNFQFADPQILANIIRQFKQETRTVEENDETSFEGSSEDIAVLTAEVFESETHQQETISFQTQRDPELVLDEIVKSEAELTTPIVFKAECKIERTNLIRNHMYDPVTLDDDEEIAELVLTEKTKYDTLSLRLNPRKVEQEKSANEDIILLEPPLEEGMENWEDSDENLIPSSSLGAFVDPIETNPLIDTIDQSEIIECSETLIEQGGVTSETMYSRLDEENMNAPMQLNMVLAPDGTLVHLINGVSEDCITELKNESVAEEDSSPHTSTFNVVNQSQSDCNEVEYLSNGLIEVDNHGNELHYYEANEEDASIIPIENSQPAHRCILDLPIRSLFTLSEDESCPCENQKLFGPMIDKLKALTNNVSSTAVQPRERQQLLSIILSLMSSMTNGTIVRETKEKTRITNFKIKRPRGRPRRTEDESNGFDPTPSTSSGMSQFNSFKNGDSKLKTEIKKKDEPQEAWEVFHYRIPCKDEEEITSPDANTMYFEDVINSLEKELQESPFKNLYSIIPKKEGKDCVLMSKNHEGDCETKKRPRTNSISAIDANTLEKKRAKRLKVGRAERKSPPVVRNFHGFQPKDLAKAIKRKNQFDIAMSTLNSPEPFRGFGEEKLSWRHDLQDKFMEKCKETLKEKQNEFS